MDRAAKRELVDHLHGVLKSTGVVVVAHNTGMVAAQSAEFRRRVKDAGGSVKVAKNTLAQLALKDTDAEKLSGLLSGPTILAFSKDPIAAAEAAVTYAKINDKLVILGGAMGKTILDANGVKALAELPSLDELRAKIIGLLMLRRRKSPGPSRSRVPSSHASFRPRQPRKRPHKPLRSCGFFGARSTETQHRYPETGKLQLKPLGSNRKDTIYVEDRENR